MDVLHGGTHILLILFTGEATRTAHSRVSRGVVTPVTMVAEQEPEVLETLGYALRPAAGELGTMGWVVSAQAFGLRSITKRSGGRPDRYGARYDRPKGRCDAAPSRRKSRFSKLRPVIATTARPRMDRHQPSWVRTAKEAGIVAGLLSIEGLR
jgi:hypothetical protein